MLTGANIAAHQARSPQLAAAARLITIVWLFSLQLWICLDEPSRFIAFMSLDVVLAVAFFEMSRGRWFPVPLFFLHLILAVYHFYTMLAGPDVFWMQAFLNRAFDIEIAYILACAGFRIYLMRTHERAV